MNDDSEGLNPTFKSALLRWLLHQGPSTVLLALILVFLGRWIPQAAESLRVESRQAREDFKAIHTEDRADFLEALKRFESRDLARTNR